MAGICRKKRTHTVSICKIETQVNLFNMCIGPQRKLQRLQITCCIHFTKYLINIARVDVGENRKRNAIEFFSVWFRVNLKIQLPCFCLLCRKREVLILLINIFLGDLWPPGINC